MRISDLYVYPIKSLRPCRVQRAKLTRTGFEHDRKFMLAQRLDDGTLKNLYIGTHDELCLFTTELLPEDENPEIIRVTFNPPEGEEEERVREMVDIPVRPEYTSLKKVDVLMHNSPGHGYDMGNEFSEFFSRNLTFETRLLYLGDGERPVLGNVAPNKIHLSKENPTDPSPRLSWTSSITGWWSGGGDSNAQAEKKDYKISFSDIAPFMIANQASLMAIGEPKFAGGERPNMDLDMTKLRPNIVLFSPEEDGDNENEAVPAFDEDYWGEVEITDSGEGVEDKSVNIVLTANCGRCKSLNVNYATGKQLPVDQQMLKKLASMNRRVDPGMKWSPVFGRYGFLKSDNDIGRFISVGQHASVPTRKDTKDVFFWPGMST